MRECMCSSISYRKALPFLNFVYFEIVMSCYSTQDTFFSGFQWFLWGICIHQSVCLVWQETELLFSSMLSTCSPLMLAVSKALTPTLCSWVAATTDSPRLAQIGTITELWEAIESHKLRGVQATLLLLL